MILYPGVAGISLVTASRYHGYLPLWWSGRILPLVPAFIWTSQFIAVIGWNMELTVRTRNAGGVVVVEFAGRMVLGQASKAATEFLRALIATNPRIVLDLDRLFFVDPSGIGALLSLYTAATANGGKLRFARPSRKIARLLESTKLSSVFPVHESEEEAIAAFAAAS